MPAGKYKKFSLMMVLTAVMSFGVGCEEPNFGFGDAVIDFFSGRYFEDRDQKLDTNTPTVGSNISTTVDATTTEEYPLPLINLSFTNEAPESDASSSSEAEDDTVSVSLGGNTNANTNISEASPEDGYEQSGESWPSEEQPSSTGSENAYWLKESNLKIDQAGSQLTWELFIVQGKNPGTNEDPSPAAAGASVLVELRGGLNQNLGGTVGQDGWVRWTTVDPGADVALYLHGISGELTWAEEEREFWSTHPALSYTSETTVTR